MLLLILYYKHGVALIPITYHRCSRKYYIYLLLLLLFIVYVIMYIINIINKLHALSYTDNYNVKIAI